MCERLGKATCLAAGVLVAVCAVQTLVVAPAEAAKVRKKPPRERLAPRAAVSSTPEATTPTADGSAPAASGRSTVPPAVGSVAPAASVPTPAIPYPVRTGLICLYGQETDPQTHAVRCLAPEELNPPRLVIVNSRPLAEQLGMLSSTTALTPSTVDGGDPPEGVSPEPEAPYEARVVSVGFENGGVGGALRNMRAMTDDMAKCIEDNGGLNVDSARLKLLFFVRSNQKASGMIVASARNVPLPVVRCVKKVILDGTIGRPSSSAVGVKVLIELKENNRP